MLYGSFRIVDYADTLFRECSDKSVRWRNGCIEDFYSDYQSIEKNNRR